MDHFFQQRAAKAWHRIGHVSSLPELENDDSYRMAPKCKAFMIPADGSSDPQAPEEADLDSSRNLKDQVLVFKYQGKVHATDHQCPHALFPLSQGKLFDIEDFGIKLSTGLTCPKHGWSFDIFTGKGDRGNYNLKVWEVQLREPSESSDAASDSDDKEVWDELVRQLAARLSPKALYLPASAMRHQSMRAKIEKDYAPGPLLDW